MTPLSVGDFAVHLPQRWPFLVMEDIVDPGGFYVILWLDTGEVDKLYPRGTEVVEILS
jgi:hypothetical protein